MLSSQRLSFGFLLNTSDQIFPSFPSPCALLGHSQYRYLVIIQIAGLTGAYGISFLIVMVNGVITALILPVLHPHPIPLLPVENPIVSALQPKRRGIKSGRRGILAKDPCRTALLVVAASFTAFTLLYGYGTLSQPLRGNRIKISLVQGNIEQEKKWNPKFAREILQIYATLTEEASRNNPDLIIWPETAAPGSITLNPMLYGEVKTIAVKSNSYLLLGSAQHQKFGAQQAENPRYFNSAFLIHPEASKPQRYDKILLFPFGEYLPYRNIIPWSHFNVQKMVDYLPGNEFTVFHTPSFRFGTTICWENAFPTLVRQFVKEGAQFIVNITNEARFGNTAAPYQLASVSVFRAVENRIFVLRCANTGVSCIIDPYGRIVERVKDETGEDIFVRGTLTGWIIPLESRTLYTRYGDWFVWVAIIGSLVFLLGTLRNRSKTLLR